ncbi:hypothetical protein J7M00_02430 [bacterium]|nr:hypothetical protein [bacterium]
MLSANKIKTLLLRRAARTSAIFNMFPDEGKVVIGLSGGADSIVLVDILFELSRRWRKKVSFYPILIDQGFFSLSDGEKNKLLEFCANRNMDLKILERREISRIVQSDANKFPPCFTCSRMRRKALLEAANEIGARTIALGHHRDDLIETFLLNIFFSRKISAIMPKQELFSGLFFIVRPMIIIDEDYIKRYAKMRAYPVIEKNCPFDKNTQREWIKKLIAQMELERQGIKNNIFRALFHPKDEYLWGEFEKISEKLLK